MDAEGAAAGIAGCAGSPSFCSGVNALQGSVQARGREGGVAEQGQAKEIAEAAEELYRTLARSQFEYSKVCCTQNGSSR